MNAEELSLIGPVVDLASVDAIHRKRLIAFVNHFLIHTASFLNQFARSCDSKLFQIQLRLHKLEASIVLLESKLSSIPGLETPDIVKAPAEASKNTIADSEANDNSHSIREEEEQLKPEETETQQPSIDPAVQKFIKMLQVGVPLPAVKLKMQQEEISVDLQNIVLNQ